MSSYQTTTNYKSQEGGGGGAFLINPNHEFANDAERDTYFSTQSHRNKLSKGKTLISVGAKFELWTGDDTPTVYDNTKWADKTSVVRGARGIQGLRGVKGASVSSAAFNGNDIEFTMSDASKVVLSGAKAALKGDKGTTGKGIHAIDYQTPDANTIHMYVTYNDAPTVWIQILAKDGSPVNLKGLKGEKGINGVGTKGDDGLDGVGVFSAAISNGNLLLTLTDGNVLNAGKIPTGISGGGITDAPSNGKTYGRKDTTWVEVWSASKLATTFHGYQIMYSLNTARTKLWIDGYMETSMLPFIATRGSTGKTKYLYDRSFQSAHMEAYGDNDSATTTDEADMGTILNNGQGKYALQLNGQRFILKNYSGSAISSEDVFHPDHGFTIVAVVNPSTYGKSGISAYVNSRLIIGNRDFGLGVNSAGFVAGGNVTGGATAQVNVGVTMNKDYIVVARYLANGTWYLHVYGDDFHLSNTGNWNKIATNTTDVFLGGNTYKAGIVGTDSGVTTAERKFMGGISETIVTTLDLNNVDVRTSVVRAMANKWQIPNVKTS